VIRPGWRSTFFFCSAIGLVSLVGGAISIEADHPTRHANDPMDRRVDWLGAFLVTAGLVLIVFVLSDGETSPNGWKTSCTSASGR
jgi:predicted MFS family arabinose efflux permease